MTKTNELPWCRHGINKSGHCAECKVASQLTTIESLQGKLDTCKKSWDEQKEQIRSLEHALSLANDDSKDSHYTWVPYAENHLETLSMPVLIEADWIRQLIALEVKPLQDRLSEAESLIVEGIAIVNIQ